MDNNQTATERLSFGYSPQYSAALKAAVLLDVVFVILSTLMMDGGRAFVFIRIALVGHWIGIFLAMWRRPLAPSWMDLFYVRFGVIINLILLRLIAPIVWSLIGESTLSGWERIRQR